MPRVARAVFPGEVHHITQRGNNQSDIFFVDDDKRFYIETLKYKSFECGLEIHAYCLMTNHVHIVAIPRRDDSLATALGHTHLLYTQYINRLHGRIGHLWQNRYYSCPVDQAGYPIVMRYVENNPVRARIVRKAWEYDWSSAQTHIGGSQTNALLNTAEFSRMATAETWKTSLTEKEDDVFTEQIRAKTNRGHALGSDSFISKLENMAGRRLRPLPNGRPKKNKNNTKTGACP